MAQATKAAAKPGVGARIGKYVTDVRSEMRRVVWPSRKEVINMSTIVLITLLFFVAYTTVLDSASTFVIDLINRLGG